MAKVIGGLFSLEASGTFAKSLTFDKRGIVRQYKVPRNAQTASQGNQRQKMAAMVKVLGIIASIDPTNSWVMHQAEATAEVSYRWRSYLLGLTTRAASFASAGAAFDAMDAAGQAAWDGEATSYGISVTEIDYASDGPISPGKALFVLAHVIFNTAAFRDLVFEALLMTPDGTNATDWVDPIVGN